MNEVTVAPSTAQEAREKKRKQRESQKRMARMATIWCAWLDFEKPLREKQPEYLKEVYRIVLLISQQKDIALNRDKQVIRWDEARNRVFTIEFLERTSLRFGKTHQEIHSDTGRIASHNSWLSGLNRRGEYWMLSDIMRGIRDASPDKGPVIAEPAEPIMLNARQINDLTTLANEKFAKARKEFLGDTPEPARTAEFGFVDDVRRQTSQRRENGQAFKKPRKNWRKEHP